MKRLAIVLGIVMLASVAAFGTGTPQGSTAADAPEVIVQLMSDAPPDVAMVTDAINELLLARLNVTVKFQHLTWTDWQQNYRLLLASGAPVDVLYAANWNDYAAYARNGAYLALDDLVAKAAPDLFTAIPKSSWDGVKIGGSIYAVPPLRYGYSGSAHMLYREDLRKRYGIAPITNVPTMLAYFDAVKANDPSMYPVQERGDGWLGTYFTNLLAKGNPGSAWETGGGLTQSSLLWLDYRNPRTPLKAPWELAQYGKFLQDMRSFAQKGYFGQDILAEVTIAPELLEAGKTGGVIGGGENVDKVQELIQRVTTNNPTWEIGDFSWDLANGFAIPSAAQQDLSTIPIQSKHPEEGLKVVQAMLLDRDLQFLVDYGIEGVHYSINDQNQYVQLPGAKGYAVFGMAAWAWKNQSLMLADGSVWGTEHDAYLKAFDGIAVANNGFALDVDPIVAELTACIQVEQQYGWPLWSGLVENIAEGQRIFEQRLTEAGFAKGKAEVQKQFLAYLAEVGQ
ncbi:MAG: extracellular solute-binding protein [Spirochaetales bacterium]|nr:MAG: extracellular solute-binding protein [Spirochaetales bacterium]